MPWSETNDRMGVDDSHETEMCLGQPCSRHNIFKHDYY